MSPKIMIVESEKQLRFWYRNELEHEGYTVVTSASGRKAVQTMTNEHIDLVVLALNLSDGFGIDYLQELIALNRTVPVVINTDYPAGKMDFYSWLADAYLLKSDNLAELKLTIRQLLRSNQSCDCSSDNKQPG